MCTVKKRFGAISAGQQNVRLTGHAISSWWTLGMHCLSSSLPINPFPPEPASDLPDGSVLCLSCLAWDLGPQDDRL